MIGQYLSNRTESATVAKTKKISQLNKALVITWLKYEFCHTVRMHIYFLYLERICNFLIHGLLLGIIIYFCIVTG